VLEVVSKRSGGSVGDGAIEPPETARGYGLEMGYFGILSMEMVH